MWWACRSRQGGCRAAWAPAHSPRPAHPLLLTTAVTTLPAAWCRCSYLQRRRDRQGAAFTYEVIIVDDGSRDGTVRAAAEFVRKHGFDAVRVLRLPARLLTASAPPSPPFLLAADEEVEEQDVDVENQYYNSKGLLESEELEEALSGFRQVLKMEGEDKGEW